MKHLEVECAPKRGLYDRALSRRERQDAQRERVIAALGALNTAQRELSVANVVEVAGIGRNTFYEYFDDIEHALNAIETRILRELVARSQTSLGKARTPLERVRALAGAWADTIFTGPTLALLALRPQPRTTSVAQHSVLAQAVTDMLSKDVTARSALPGLGDPLKVSAVAALFDALSRARLSSNQPWGVDDLHPLLTELALRLLR